MNAKTHTTTGLQSSRSVPEDDTGMTPPPYIPRRGAISAQGAGDGNVISKQSDNTSLNNKNEGDVKLWWKR